MNMIGLSVPDIELDKMIEEIDEDGSGLILRLQPFCNPALLLLLLSTADASHHVYFSVLTFMFLYPRFARLAR